jgi:formylglycine-generating enzyme required for sulfatase activity
MDNKQLTFGVIFCFFIAGLFAFVIYWDMRKSAIYEEKVRGMQKTMKPVAVEDSRDFSVYETYMAQDGHEMVLIPEGVFTRGSLVGDIDEKPQQEIYLDAFYADKYEVTVKDYDRYRRATNYVAPSVPFFQNDEKELKAPDLPVVGVSWMDAVNYCTWAGKRLLTEAEWEKSARGTHGLDYPWGNHDVGKAANLSGAEDGFPLLAPVGSFSSGRSAYGLYDMAGNVAEWVNDWYDQFYYEKAPIMNPTGPETGKNRVFRGGSWDSRMPDVRAAKRFAASEGRKDATLGFRCGLSLKDKPKE